MVARSGGGGRRLNPIVKTAKRRRRVRRIGAVLIGVTAAVAVAELGLRWHLGDRLVADVERERPQDLMGRFDPDLGWTMRPDASTRIGSGEGASDVRLNARGLRGGEHAYEPAPGVRRIVVLGDSFAWGWGVGDGEVFTDVLDDLLGPGIEVVNLAVPGYSTDQQLWTLEREGLRYHPDVVLLAFCTNDPWGNQTSHAFRMLKPYYRRDTEGDWRLENHPVERVLGEPTARGADWMDAVSARSALLSVVTGRVAFRRSRAEEFPDYRNTARHWRNVHPQGPIPRDSTTYMLLRRLRSACAAADAALVAFWAAEVQPQHVDELGADRPGRAEPVFPIARRLADVGRELGFETVPVDAAHVAAVRAGAQLILPFDIHWNPAGHRVTAEALEPRLRALLK